MSHKHGKGKFNKKGGKKNKNGGGGGGASNIGHGNFDEVMKGFIIMTDRDREKNAVKDANNFLIPIIEDLYPHIYEGKEIVVQQHEVLEKKLKVDECGAGEQKEVTAEIPQEQINQNEQSKEVEVEQQQQGETENSQDKKEEEVEKKGEEEVVVAEEEAAGNQENDEEEDNEEEEEEENENNGEGEGEQDNKEQIGENKQRQETANEKLEQELNALKSNKDKLLYNVNTDVKCTVFLKVNSKLMNNLNVTEVVENIMHKVHDEKTTLTRFCHRMYPAEYAFRADEANLKKYMELLIKEKIQTESPSSWMLECKSRNNNKFNRKNVLNIVSELMPKIHFVDYKVPFYTVVVDVCHNLMCLSILKSYYDYKKYSVKVNPQLNNQKDYSFLNQNKPAPKVVVPVTEEQLKELEQQQEEKRAQLRAEQIVKNDEEDDVDLI